MNRVEYVHIVSKRLSFMTALAIAVLSALFAVSFLLGDRLMLTYLAFNYGINGGFVSIQQRIQSVSDNELELRAQSWHQIPTDPDLRGRLRTCALLPFPVGHCFGPRVSRLHDAETGDDGTRQ